MFSLLKYSLAVFFGKLLFHNRKKLLLGLILLSGYIQNAYKNPDKLTKDLNKSMVTVKAKSITFAKYSCKNIYGKTFLGIRVPRPKFCDKKGGIDELF